jgi:hypothetical protein
MTAEPAVQISQHRSRFCSIGSNGTGRESRETPQLPIEINVAAVSDCGSDRRDLQIGFVEQPHGGS